MDARAREASAGAVTRQFVFLPPPRLRRFHFGFSARCIADSRTDISGLPDTGHPEPSAVCADFKTKLAKSRDIFAAPLEGAALIARRASVAVRALPTVAMASRSVLRRGIAAFAEATRGVAAGNALARQGGVTANRYDAPA